MCIPCSALNETVKVRTRFSSHLRLKTSFIIIMTNNQFKMTDLLKVKLFHMQW